MPTFKKNSFIKWSSQDEEGTFSHTGQVVKHADGMIIFTDKKGGEMGVPEDEGKFTSARKPKTWKKPVADKVTKPVTKKAKRVAGAPTKYEQVVELFNAEKPRSRKEAIALAVEEVEMTPAGASTYVAKANKELKLW